MGLRDFWKKKTIDQPIVPPLGGQTLETDLPSISGGLPPIPSNDFGNSMQQFSAPDTKANANVDINANQLPSLDISPQSAPKSISFNIPSLDFSLPPADDDEDIPKPQSTAAPSFTQVQGTTLNNDLDDDLNKLFITDSDWKEPDWTNFEPYTEDKIDEPKPEDFKGADLPNFADGLTNDSNSPNLADESSAESAVPFIEPAEPFRKKINTAAPLELFIRGSAYNKVFTELDQMNIALTKIDSQVNAYEDMLKKEEPLLAVAKDQMEYLYRRLNNVDKKIFAQ